MFTISLLSLPFDLDRNDDNLSPVAVYGKKYNFRNSNGSTDRIPFMGVNMRGLYTSLQHDTNRYSNAPFPIGYYENSFKLISQAGMNHVRYVFYWEAYEKNPSLFLRELETVANTADKWNLKVLYDNHQYQYHTPRMVRDFLRHFFLGVILQHIPKAVEEKPTINLQRYGGHLGGIEI